jgi:recombination protein RecT
MAQNRVDAPAIIGNRENLGEHLKIWKARLQQIYGEDQVTTARLLAIADACVRRNPDLAQCTVDSFRSALEDAAVLKLLPTGLMNLGHIIPFRNQKGSKDAVFIAGYRGLLDIAYRSKKIAGYDVGLVHVLDGWDYTRGLDTILQHSPEFEGLFTYETRKQLRCAYAVWWDVIDGQPVAQRHLVLNFEELERLRLKSKQNKDGESWGPWKDDYQPMVLKALVRASTKLMPLTPAEDSLLAAAFSKEDAKMGMIDPVVDIEPDAPDAPEDNDPKKETPKE